MTDEKKPVAAPLDEFDWDQALAEWESHTFVPEVARDVVPERSPGVPAAASKPLYRPPSVSPTPAAPRNPVSDDDATVIAAIPRELLRSEDRDVNPWARPGGGGLSQLFSRDGARDPAATGRVSPIATPAAQSVSSASSAEGPTDELASQDTSSEDTPAAPLGQTVISGVHAVLAASDGLAVYGEPGSAVAHQPQAPAPAPTRVWHDERPASAWLDDSIRPALEHRANWLEDEARALPDGADRARALLSCSEIVSLLGERERAHGLALEARDLAPWLVTSHRQARQLLPWPPDPDDHIEALNAELQVTPPGPAHLHASLLFADALGASGNDEGVETALADALNEAHGDIRPAMARAVRALARRETTSASLNAGDAAELAPLRDAIGTCLRVRGVQAVGAVGPNAPGDISALARRAIADDSLGAAASWVAELGRGVPELASAARWLAAAFAATNPDTRHRSLVWLHELVDRGEVDATRPLVARGLELGDLSLVSEAIDSPGPLTAAERVTLAALAGLPLVASDEHFDGHDAADGLLQPLFCALAAVATPPDHARPARTAGTARSRACVQLGRLLAARAAAPELHIALDTVGEFAAGAAARGVALELAARDGQFGDISRIVESWGATRTGGVDAMAEAPLAAALVAERARDVPRAHEAFKAARFADPGCEAALRALSSLEPVDLVSEMSSLADACGDGLRAALARIEAVTRGESMLADKAQSELLIEAYRAAPSLPVAPFLGERIARRTGDIDQVLYWVRERRRCASDVVESALDSVREALLVADSNPELACERLREAQSVRPADVALRDLYERMAGAPPDDRAQWRELRAAETTGAARILLSLEAAYEYERIGDNDGAFRCAAIAAVNETALGRIARERAELRTGRVARLADELLATGKLAADVRSRREAYERLAVLDATARQDASSALLWHRAILEDVADYKPSLRYIEEQYIGEGRDDELETIAASIARSLRMSGVGEATAHAELAARLRMRAEPGNWEGAREMIELACAENECSLGSLRLLHGLTRALNDDDALIAVTLRLVDRVMAPADMASLLLRGGQAAIRLGRFDQAIELLERASINDPGDVVTLWLVCDLKRQARDWRGAAEAFESVARSTRVGAEQLAAWYEAGRLWQDDVSDEDRAVSALKLAASIDITHADVFERLAKVYANHKRTSELAELLESRIERATDPDERISVEVRRGRILLNAGDTAGARRSLEATLTERPDEPNALSALADACIIQADWDGAEQALVRLSRLLPTADEQRGVYARLGDLYSSHLVNLPRAEVALKEVLKRAPDDDESAEKLVGIYIRLSEPDRAIELQQERVAHAPSPEERRRRLVELALLQEGAARDPRRAEKTLETARREFPQDVDLLRALAEFYVRQHQTPAVNILLDRATADARRAVSAGRLTSAAFDVIACVFELRGNAVAARAVESILAATEGRSTTLQGGGDRAFDASFDDAMAPELLTPALRTLLARAGDALDKAAPVDLRELRATPLAADSPFARIALRAAASSGIPDLQMFSSPKLKSSCVPIGSNPAALVIGEGLASSDRAGKFLVLRAVQLVTKKAATLGRLPAGELSVLLAGWLKCFNPSWEPKSIPAASLAAARDRVQENLPRALEPELGILALEAIGHYETSHTSWGLCALEWANRVALLALGDPNAALDAIALAGGAAAGAPRDPRDRLAFIARTPQSRDIVTFGVSDAFAEARARLGLNG